jgi:hypothetical protein
MELTHKRINFFRYCESIEKRFPTSLILTIDGIDKKTFYFTYPSIVNLIREEVKNDYILKYSYNSKFLSLELPKSV